MPLRYDTPLLTYGYTIPQFSTVESIDFAVTFRCHLQTKKPLPPHNYDKPDPTAFADEPMAYSIVMLSVTA